MPGDGEGEFNGATLPLPFDHVYLDGVLSVAPTSAADGERNSLMLTYYDQNGAFDRLAERAKRLWVFFAYAMRR